MRIRDLKSVRALSCSLLVIAGISGIAGTAAAQELQSHIVYTPARGALVAKAGNVTNHGGGVIVSAKVVFVFWGPSFNNAASPDFAYARTLQADRNQFGMSPEYKVLQEYGVMPSNLGSGTPDWFDTSTPPVKVTDATVQAEVNRYLAVNAFNASTIYEVVIPKTSYSDDGSGTTSCGGPALAYCAYHSWIGSGANATKYSIQPYPSCSGCKVTGWSDVQNQEHFFCHETREAVTDPTGTTWWDSNGAEIDDKCAWSPTPFLGTGGYACQYEWSNQRHMCVKF
ncbi:MAG TPA: hypothetical protein VIA62_04495 [Thermoanaerobaculia bacterium]|jgi:hypothetical protein|nr:hypothetical protein [Thermoanaerobaculia bacterium]